MELTLSKGYIKNKEDFISKFKEKFPLTDFNKEDENIIYSKIILIKNYLISKEFNSIMYLPIFKYSLNSLSRINLTANNLETIPEVFNQLTELSILILNNNKIVKIENLLNLKKLEKLELRGNKISKIEGLKNLINLKCLTLSCNLINKIENDDFPIIESLNELGLFGNYLGIENKFLDQKINEENMNELKNFCFIIKSKCKNLKSLYIGGNFFTNLIKNGDKTSEIENNDYKEIIKSEISPGLLIDGQQL